MSGISVKVTAENIGATVEKPPVAPTSNIAIFQEQVRHWLKPVGYQNEVHLLTNFPTKNVFSFPSPHPPPLFYPQIATISKTFPLIIHSFIGLF